MSAVGKSLYEALDAEGLLEFGAFIRGGIVREHLNIEELAVGTRAQFAAIALQELGAVDAVREMLLHEGKYITASGDGYRILTPGENADQIKRYIAHAQNKLRRAHLLERTSPAMSNGRPSQVAARLLLAEASTRRKRPGEFEPPSAILGPTP